jgi:predicted RNase H-like nuclease (RuvC/YqgF family)
MDLTALLKEAMEEGNKELKEKRIFEFKKTIKSYIQRISNNNETIEALQRENDELKKGMTSVNLKDFSDITLVE